MALKKTLVKTNLNYIIIFPNNDFGFGNNFEGNT